MDDTYPGGPQRIIDQVASALSIENNSEPGSMR